MGPDCLPNVPVLTRWEGQAPCARQPARGRGVTALATRLRRTPAGTGSKDGLDKAVCERQGIPILADLAYQGGGPWGTTGVKRRPHHGLTPTQQTVNRSLARTRAPAERGVARLKSWRIFRHARCSPNRMTSIAKAVLTLERHR